MKKWIVIGILTSVAATQVRAGWSFGLSVGVAGPVYCPPPVVAVAPPPVVVAPAPVYVTQPVVLAPGPVYVAPPVMMTAPVMVPRPVWIRPACGHPVIYHRHPCW